MARTDSQLSTSEILTIGELDGIANNSVIYKDNAGEYQAVALSTSGKVFQSNGATSAPSFETVSGTGDVVGPASATDNAIARFDSTTGKLLQNSSTTISDGGSLEFEGNAAKTASMARHTTANTAGNALTITAGGATSGATNKNGGDLNLGSGIPTGTGSSSVYINAYRPTSSGTSDGTNTTLGRFWNPSSSESTGRMLIGSSAGTDSQIGLNLFGNNDTNVYVQRITSSSAGKGLTIQAGGAFSGGTDLSGGNVTIKSGIPTGTATSQVIIQTPTPGSTGTSDNSFATRVTIDSVGVAVVGKVTMDGLDVGYKEIPQNSNSADYTLVLGDSGKHIYHPSADTTARTITIPANASVAYPIGTAITFVNDTSAGVLTIAITSDTLVLAGAGTTGSRTLAANGMATAVKVTSTRWMISGTGLT